ncbi:hypothetical protein ACS0TY_014998 [Phlomoides rotata]
MASSPPLASSFLLLAAAVVLLISPASSQTCKSQKFSHNKTKFTNCTDLPTLKAQLHWAYDPSAKPNPTLSVAYIAPPARPDGWVAWALNPTGSGMVGSQALVAFNDVNGSVVVRTYNITEYGPIVESRIAYDVLSKSADHSGGVTTIFATLALPPGKTLLNQVWQVGAAVKDGVPVKHDFSPENLGSKGTLQLNGNVPVPAPFPVPAQSPAPALVPATGKDAGGSWRIYGSGVGLCGAVSAVLLGVVLGF